jgi:cation transport ATPase
MATRVVREVRYSARRAKRKSSGQNPSDERAPDFHGGLLHKITGWLGSTLLIVCVVATFASDLSAIILILKWLFIIVALPLVRYVFHLSTLAKMVATLCILVIWFWTEVLRHGLQFAVARALNIAVVVCVGATFASGLGAIALIGQQIWAWLFVTNVEWVGAWGIPRWALALVLFIVSLICGFLSVWLDTTVRERIGAVRLRPDSRTPAPSGHSGEIARR